MTGGRCLECDKANNRHRSNVHYAATKHLKQVQHRCSACGDLFVTTRKTSKLCRACRIASAGPGTYQMTGRNGKIGAEHRMIAYALIGMAEMEGLHVHHISGNRSDNRLDNLMVLSDKDHRALHRHLTLSFGRLLAQQPEDVVYAASTRWLDELKINYRVLSKVSGADTFSLDQAYALIPWKKKPGACDKQCPTCQKPIRRTRQVYCSKECVPPTKGALLTKEVLLDLTQRMSLQQIAAAHGVTYSCVQRRCYRMEVPFPKRFRKGT